MHRTHANAKRRRALLLGGAALLAPRALAQPLAFSAPRMPRDTYLVTPLGEVRAGRTLRFPQDEGAHPAFRTEWWYITGWLESSQRAFGFQVTFFRARPEIDERNPSAFAPGQIVIAHAALSDPARGHLLHDQTVARAALGLAGADEQRMHVWADDWSLAREGARFHARVPARELAIDLEFTRTQPPLLQGDAGVSRKGPRPESASYYYSVPQLAVAGAVGERERKITVSGRAWLDHEWSSSYIDERASGWDWLGINFDDGAALMVFRMRDKTNATFWAGGAYRTAGGARRAFEPHEIEFVPLRTWRSPRTGASYPIAWRIRAGALEITIEPLMDDQENDTRISVGTIYWEGAVRALHAGARVGRGYLELTGYWRRVKL